MEEQILIINSRVKQVKYNSFIDKNYSKKKFQIVKFENDRKLIFSEKLDCCACIYLENFEKIFAIGKYIEYMKLRSDKNGKSLWLAGYASNEEIFNEPFYNSNNGYYSPNTDIILVNEIGETIFETSIYNEDVEIEE